MTSLSILIIGGTGTISSEVVALAVNRQHDVTVLNRGNRVASTGVTTLRADIRSATEVRAAIGTRRFDVVVDFLAFTAEHVQQDIDMFENRVGQYVFVSSASAYQKPPLQLPITESTPLRNPFSGYSRNKIACEELLVTAYRDRGFPVTIVRPSHTYDRASIPLNGGWTTIDRLRRGKPAIVHGDGTSLWVLTHSRDFAVGFVGLLGNPHTIGDAVQITSDEVLTWNQITTIMADAAGATPNIVHVTSDALALADPGSAEGHLGDRSHSVIFDNSKIRALVPAFRPATTFAFGAREIIDWYDQNPQLQVVDPRLDALFEELAAAHS